MKTLKPLLGLTAALFLILSSCQKSPENEVKLLSTNFQEEIELEQNLSFSFNKDLAPVSKIGDWDTIAYITFNPVVKGRFKWVSASELVFSPESSFDGSTKYQAAFTKKILNVSDQKGLYFATETQKSIAFHTPFLKLDEIQAYWSKGETDNRIYIKTKLLFNYSIDGKQLESLVKIKLDDKEVAYKLANAEVNSEFELLIEANPDNKNDIMISAEVDKGLIMTNNRYATEEKMTASQILVSRFKLEITDFESRLEGNIGYLKFYASQDLDATSINAVYSINPELNSSAKVNGNVLEIEGAFDISNPYTLTINKKLKGVYGGILNADYVKAFSFSEQKPSISFLQQKAIYLSGAGSQSIGINIINVPKVKVTIQKIYENNILAYLRNNSYYNYGDYYYDDGEGEAYSGGHTVYNEDHSGDYSNVVYEAEVLTASLPSVNGMKALKLNIPEENNKYKGIYLVKISSSDAYYLQATKLVSVSDVGLTAKKMKNKVMVFAHSIIDTKPLSGIDINLVSTNNQLMQNKKTNKDGVVVFDALDKNAKGFEPGLITATTAGDFNYMPFNATLVETSRFDVGGKYSSQSGFDTYIYGPRALYRPGETIYFNTLIRDQKWNSCGEIPLKAKLLLPNGKEYQVLKLQTNKQGAASCEFQLPENAVTGFYNFEVYNGDNTLLASQSINVEEFMPDRIKVKLSQNKDEYVLSDTQKISGTATNLFGPPAANRNYEVNRSLRRINFESKNFKDYNFFVEAKESFENEYRQGKTAENGSFTEKFSINKSWQDMGIIQSTIYATVFDESGRPVNRNLSSKIYTQKVFYGINLPEYYVATQQAFNFRLIGVTKADKIASGAKARVEIYRNEWQSVLENNLGYYNYRSKKIQKLVESRIISFGNQAYEMSFNPKVSGEYEIRIKRDGSELYTASTFYAFGWGNTANTSFEVNSEGQVDISTDKEVYKVGDKAKVLFKTPFKGKLLVTIEQNDVFEYKVIDTDNKSAEYIFTVKDIHLPNVFVSATLFRPMGESAMPLTVAHGYAPIKVEKADSRLPLEIIASEQSRSKTKQKIKVKSKALADIEVTLAVVDEGILQIKDFKNPDPHAFFYQNRALEVSSHDVYALLLAELMQKSKTGGDGYAMEAYDLNKRVNPLSNSRVKLLSFWSGILKTNSRGEAEYELEIPQFSGELRVMAVAYKDKAFGSANKSIKVSDPIVISTALPRFLSPKDELPLPVMLSNTTNKAATAKIQVNTTGNVNINGNKTETVKIPANSETQVVFNISAKAAIGGGNVKVKVDALGESFVDETDITVRPTASLIKFSGNGMVSKQGTHPVELENSDDFIAGSSSAKLSISRSPMVRFTKNLNYLLGYPHGCLEQTVSKAFPQIYLADIIKEMGSTVRTGDEDELNPNFNVQAAIRKISGMQRYNGSFSYWPGGNSYNNWAHVYATHFLVEAKKAGFEVNRDLLEKALTVLHANLKNKRFEEEWYYQNNWISRKYIDRSIIYGLFVLANAGKVDKASMNHYKANLQELSIDSRYLLAAAFALAGDMSAYRAVLPANYKEEQTGGQFGNNFSSDFRNAAISLYALVQSEPKNAQIGVLANNLSERIRKLGYYNTQELSFALLALGKLAKNNAGSTATAIVKAGGKTIGNFSSKSLVLTQKELTQGDVSLQVAGSGNLYYFWETEGISATGKYKEEDNYLEVRRTYYNRFGQVISNKQFNQNDLVVVKVSLRALQSLQVDNVVITDMLPAGFEVENPRLTDVQNYEWIQNRSYPEHFDIRDDRINFYTTAYSKVNSYYYVVRAVSKGTFQLGPVSADAMYNGAYHSYHGGGLVVVK